MSEYVIQKQKLMGNKRESLIPGEYFHLYNRANADDPMFRQQRDYYRFLKMYEEYIAPLTETYCYCLMPNHFHFLIKMKDDKFMDYFFGLDSNSERLPNILANEFGKGFNSYAKYYNKKYDRKGSLFIHTFNRKPVKSMNYLTLLVCYIHLNPYRAGITEKVEGWRFNSYHNFYHDSKPPIALKMKEAIEWFDNKKNFIFVHENFLNNNPEG